MDGTVNGEYDTVNGGDGTGCAAYDMGGTANGGDDMGGTVNG